MICKKISFVFFLLFIFTLNLFSNAVEFYNMGEESFNKNTFDEALYYYKKALDENPYYTKAILRVIEINVLLNNLSEADLYIKKLLNVSPDNIKGLIYKGNLYLKLYKNKSVQNLKEAKKYLKTSEKSFLKILNIKPLNYDAILGMAKIALIRNDFLTARDYLNKLLKINKDRIDAYLIYADMFIMKNKYKKAKEFLKKAEHIFPNNPKIFYYYGLINEKKNNLKRAKFFYERSYYYNPFNSNTVLNLLNIYFKLRDWKKVIDFAEKSLEDFPDTYLLYNKQGLAYFFKNDIDKCIKNLKKSYELNSTDDIVKYYLEEVLINKKSFYTEDRKKFAEKHFLQAERYNKNFYTKDALFEFKRGLQIYSEDWKRRYELSLLYKKLGLLEKYLKELKIAITLNPYNTKLKDKYEIAKTFRKKRLGYELKINQYEISKDKIKIFTPSLNPEGNNYLHNQTGLVLGLSINNHLRLFNKFRVIDPEIDNPDFYFPLSRKKCKYLAKINGADYYLFGSFTENGEYISVSVKLYPVLGDEEIVKFESVAKGKDKIYFLSKDIAQKINDFFKTFGSIIKIKTDNNFIINLGTADGVKKGDRIEIYDKGSIYKDFIFHKYFKKPPQKVGTAKIIKVDEQIAEAEPEKITYIDKISLNDKVFLIQKKK